MYALISFSHENTNLDLRERLHVDDALAKELLASFVRLDLVEEALLLSTCNRCEIYVFLQAGLEKEAALRALEEIIEIFALKKGLPKELLQGVPRLLCDTEAIYHTFCVASALLSLAIGETQISGQLKAAYRLSYEEGFASKHLTRLMHFAFRCAAEVRNKTDISKNPISIASVAASVAIDFLATNAAKFSNQRPRLLVIGAGEMGILCLKYLSKHDCHLSLCNRTHARAKAALDSLGLADRVSLLDFSSLKSRLNDYHVVLGAASGGSLVSIDDLASSHLKRLFVDLALPRNFNFSLEDLENLKPGKVDLVGIDGLKSRAAVFLESRRQGAREAHEIVAHCLGDFQKWLSTLELEPLIKTLRLRAKEASIKELNRALKKGFIPESLRENALKLLHSAFNDFLHTPTVRLRELAQSEKYDTVLESISTVFGEESSTILINHYKCEK